MIFSSHSKLNVMKQFIQARCLVLISIGMNCGLHFYTCPQQLSAMSNHHVQGFGICLDERNGPYNSLDMVLRFGVWTLHVYHALLLRDAWAKHKDLDSYEAKWLYVDAMLKVESICLLYLSAISDWAIVGAAEVFRQNRRKGPRPRTGIIWGWSC